MIKRIFGSRSSNESHLTEPDDHNDSGVYFSDKSDPKLDQGTMGNRSGGLEKKKFSKRPEISSPRPEENKSTYSSNHNNGKLHNVATPGGEQYFVRPSPSKEGAVPYKFGEFEGNTRSSTDGQEKKIEIVLYRSYRSLNKFGSKYGVQKPPSPDIKYYRRSTQSLSKLSSTMPRSTSMASHNEMNTKSHTAPRGVSRSKSAVDGELYHPNTNRNQIQIKNKIGMSSQKLQTKEMQTNSHNNKLNPVICSDFPTISEVKNRRALFENRYIRSLRDLYSSLPVETQLKSLCLAVELPCKRGQGPPREVSLHDYFTSTTASHAPSAEQAHSSDHAPIDIADRSRYRLCVNEAMGVSLGRARHDARKWSTSAVDLLTSVASEAAGELSRVYEYQICMLRERTSVELLAKHAAECAVEYTLHGDRLIRRNRLCHAALLSKPASVNSSPRCSVILGDNEYKWDLFAALKLPGLRQDTTHATSARSDTPLAPPIVYYAGGLDGLHDSSRYGYRAQFVDWDPVYSCYLPTCDLDVALKALQQATPTADHALHQRYAPYCRLVGADTMTAYLEAADMTSEPVSLGEYVWRVVGRELGQSTNADSAQEVKAVYRPLVGQLPPSLEGRRLADVDLTRVRNNKSVGKTFAVGTSIRESDADQPCEDTTTTIVNDLESVLEGGSYEDRIAEDVERDSNSPFSDNGRTSNDSGTGESVTDALDRVDGNDNDVANTMKVPRKSCLKKPKESREQSANTRRDNRREQPGNSEVFRQPSSRKDQNLREFQPLRERIDTRQAKDIRKETNRPQKAIRSPVQMHYGTAV